ncbi:hypothetical protein BHE90_017673 [Fusarium euwallaceae]|uniref:Uncharacterized protein n=1 Tax=Fusarium euwallaceae TaxID=1147111 RepID=A0A430KWU3_9HYPO|nr:hypothetical protein BHE90_017673 [Fusarium euwallaceae]
MLSQGTVLRAHRTCAPRRRHDPAQAYPAMTIGDTYHNYTLASTVPMMFPSIIHASAAIEREPYQAGDELAISATYHYTPPMSFNAPCPYDQPNFHSPGSSDHSSNCSEAGYEYPTEPLSMQTGPARFIPKGRPNTISAILT